MNCADDSLTVASEDSSYVGVDESELNVDDDLGRASETIPYLGETRQYRSSSMVFKESYNSPPEPRCAFLQSHVMKVKPKV